jgi:agmatine deiminase
MAAVQMDPPVPAGFVMPAEWAPHTQTWMGWPTRTDNWRNGGLPAKRAWVAVAAAIAQFEPVTVCAPSAEYVTAATMLAGVAGVRVVEMAQDDAWFRDSGPLFLTRAADGAVAGANYDFNAWGGADGGCYPSWEQDRLVGRKILAMERAPRHACPMVLEGGSIDVDGEGTVLTTEVCLLNKNRNPHLSRADIEASLGHIGIRKVVWLPGGLYNDEDTNGHIDNMARFVGPGEVLVAWTDDEADPQYPNSKQAYDVLCAATDALGRPLRVHKMPMPTPLFRTEEEAGGVDAGAAERVAGERLPASYANYLLVNGGIVMPAFGVPEDAVAADLLARLHPGRRVAQVPSREILLGGGNIHCITQQQPAPPQPR